MTTVKTRPFKNIMPDIVDDLLSTLEARLRSTREPNPLVRQAITGFIQTARFEMICRPSCWKYSRTATSTVLTVKQDGKALNISLTVAEGNYVICLYMPAPDSRYTTVIFDRDLTLINR